MNSDSQSVNNTNDNTFTGVESTATRGNVLVINKNHFKNKPLPAGAIFIGRPSPFGNPFTHLKNTNAPCEVETRDEAVRRYAYWLAESAEAETARQMVKELAQKVFMGETIHLLCYCAPQSCHGNILKHHILRIAGNLSEKS